MHLGNKKKGEKMRKNTKSKSEKKGIWKIILPIIIAILGGIGITVAINTTENGGIKVQIEYAPEVIPALIENDEGEVFEDETIPTVEDIDGGGEFQDKDTGLSISEGDVYYELGAIEWVDTSSPEAFKESVYGRCIIANNVYGAQCVSLARAFWWDYAGFDVSTCGTGLAKGMMNCADDNAKDKFKVIWDVNEIQNGTWIVLDGSWTGHICMAMGPVKNGYVACLGENQGGNSCPGVAGAAANIINLSVKNFIGGYTPYDYIVPEPEPEPEPVPDVPDTGIVKF